MSKRGALFLMLAHAAFVAFLGLRPWVPGLKDLMYESQVGAYTMFSARVNSRTTATLIGPEGRKIEFDYRYFLWRNPLINTTHSHLSPRVVERFADFLAHRPEIHQVVRGKAHPWKVAVVVRFRRDTEAERTIAVEHAVATQ